MKNVGIYARVSTKEQSFEQQVIELRDFCGRMGWDVAAEYIDEGVSALKRGRPGLEKLLEDVRQRKVDVVLVYKLDRLGRSMHELVEVLEHLRLRGVDFVSYTQREIDTTTPLGKMFFNLLATFAEFERSLISERTRAKLKMLKAQGRRLGRPGTVDKDKIRELRERGFSMRRVAREAGCSLGAVAAVLKT